MRRLPDSYYSGSFFCLVSLHLHSTAAMAAPSAADVTMGGVATPNRATTPEVAITTDTSDQGTPPPQNYTEANYRFNHSAWHYGLLQPASRSTRLPLRHHCTTTLPMLNFSLHLHLKSINYAHNNKQPLDYTRPIHRFPGDLRIHTTIPHCSVHYFHTTSLHTTTGNNYCSTTG